MSVLYARRETGLVTVVDLSEFATSQILRSKRYTSPGGGNAFISSETKSPLEEELIVEASNQIFFEVSE
jgi:hypothetical protein